MVRFWPTWGPVLCLVAAVALVFGYAATGEFVQWDDPDMVVNNPRLNPPSWEKTAEFWREPVLKLYTPLAYTVWAGVAAMEDRAPGEPLAAMPFHLLNLAFHLAAGIAVFLLLRELMENAAAAAVGALVFLVHPLQVEPVAWVSGMNGVLGGALAMAALWQYVVYARTQRRAALLTATVLFAAALLSKPTTVVVPAIAAVLDAFILRRPLKAWARPILFWSAMAVAMAIKAERVQPASHIDAPPIGQRLLIAGDALEFYAAKIVAPIGLTFDYGRTPARVLADRAGAWPRLVLLLVLVGLPLALRRARWMPAVLLIFVAALAPALGLVPFEFQSYSTVADRYMYLPMFAVALLAACVTRSLPRWPAAIVLLALAGRAFDQTLVWHDTPALAHQQLAIDPASATGHKIYASWLAAHGQADAAEDQYRAAIASMQATGGNNAGVVRYDLGNLLLREHRFDDAVEQFTQALPLLPSELTPPAHNNLGEALYFMGDRQGARREFEAALARQPDFAPAQQNLKLLGEK